MKKLGKLGVIIVLGLILVSGACKKPYASDVLKREPAQEFGSPQKAAGYAWDQGGFGAMPTVEYWPLEGRADQLVMPGRIRYPAHAKYLTDASTFGAPPSPPIGVDNTAVVGSEIARLYPLGSVRTAADLAKLGKGEALPIGTLVAINARITDSDESYGGMFEFEDHLNYFYEVSIAGKKGIVFGADLYGLDASAEKNAVTALRYRTKGRYDSFLPLYGLDTLDEPLMKRLEKDRVAFDEVDPASFYLGPEHPDDMLALYASDRTDPQRCVFITTDLVSHALHLVFDRYLQRVEEEYFFTGLKELVEAYLEKLDGLEAADPKTIQEYSKTLELARLYLEVPQAILAAAPERSWNEDKREFVYSERDQAAIYGTYSPAVREILDFMAAHEGFETIPEILYKEDFSQYKPRGHYTKNGVLSAYFQAMMWFGRIHLYMAMADPPPYVWLSDEAKASATELSLELTPVAVLFNSLTDSSPELLAAWERLFDPITYLIGVSDDLSFDDVMPFVRREGIKDFPAWTADESAILAMVKKAAKELRPPLIAGNSVLFVPSGEKQTPPMGWRLFGQRFTYDSAVHMQTSSPRLSDRSYVQGLDIMRAFGSETADRLLSQAPPGSGGYADYPRLKEIVDGFMEEFSGYKPDFWGQTYYNRALFLIKSQAQFEQGAGFYFTETPLWGYKAMNAAHGTWAELRHDTILYVKQVYGERTGGGDWEPTWRTKPVPEPIHYIEPNLPFFTGARLLVRDLYEKTAKMNLLPEAYANALEGLDSLLAEATEIVRLEVEDKVVDAERNEFIASIPGKLSGLVNPEAGAAAAVDPEQLKMALVADVYTNAGDGAVLEVAVGVPRRMWTLLNDGQGGKRVAVGYTFSYYEFIQAMDNRLDDDQWKALVYAPGADLAEYEPFWAKGVASGFVKER